MYGWENLPLEGKKAKLEELMARIAQVKAAQPLRKQQAGTQAAAERMMQEDPGAAFNLMDRAREMTAEKPGGLGEDDRTAVEVRNLRNLVASNNFANLDEAKQRMYLDRLSTLESGQAGTKYAPKGTMVQEPAAAGPDFAAAKGEASALIGSARDANNDGNIDDYASMKSKLEDIIRRAGLGKADAEDLRRMFADKETEIQRNERAQAEKQERTRNEARASESASQSGGAIDKRAATQKIDDIQANPNDNTTIADAVLWYMRKQSGAMIGPTEILQYMQGKLPEDKYKQLVGELSPTGLRAIAGYVAGSAFSDPMITQITAKYTPYIKKDRLIRDLNVYAQKNIQKPLLREPVKTAASTKAKKSGAVGNAKWETIE